MTGPATDRAAALCARLYALLLVAYPAAFRRDYGPQMARDFRDCCRAARRRRGARGVLGVWTVALGDLMVSACAERRAQVTALFSGDKARRRALPMTTFTTDTAGVAALTGMAPAGKGRMRAAIVVDVAVGLATLPVLGLTIATLDAILWPGDQHLPWWSVLLMSAISLALTGVAVALLARLAARGQTPGLAITGLRWADGAGRPAWRRLLAEPQAWCAALPAAYVFLVTPADAARFFVPLETFWAASSTFATVIGPALLLGALACMVVSRRHPGRLVARA